MPKQKLVAATHVIIPDTQIGPDTPTDHLRWIGYYVAEKYARRPNTKIIMLGDWYDMASLSWYDRGKRSAEGRRVVADIDAGNVADEDLVAGMLAEGKHRTLELHKLRGNHEERMERYTEDHPMLDGGLPEFTDGKRWQIHPFLEVVRLDGVSYSHYFYNPMSGKPYGGQNIDTRLKTIGTSFTMGHQQGLKIGTRDVLGHPQWGLVAGSCYLHDEVYKGPQGNAEWRGIVVCHKVRDGAYDPKLVSLDSLCERYENMTLADYTERYLR